MSEAETYLLPGASKQIALPYISGALAADISIFVAIFTTFHGLRPSLSIQKYQILPWLRDRAGANFHKALHLPL